MKMQATAGWALEVLRRSFQPDEIALGMTIDGKPCTVAAAIAELEKLDPDTIVTEEDENR